jgi:hypothetical protein
MRAVGASVAKAKEAKDNGPYLVSSIIPKSPPYLTFNPKPPAHFNLNLNLN